MGQVARRHRPAAFWYLLTAGRINRDTAGVESGGDLRVSLRFPRSVMLCEIP